MKGTSRELLLPQVSAYYNLFFALYFAELFCQIQVVIVILCVAVTHVKSLI